MMSQTLQISPAPNGQVVGEMRPLRQPILAHVSAQLAWARLANEGLNFLVIVEGGGGRMVGVVTRDSLRPAACCARHGSACSVVNHRAGDAAFCFVDEDLGGIREAEASHSQEYPYPPKRSVPLVVVDRRLRPVGFIGPSSAIALSPQRQSAA
jgi:hypothetical protein